LVQCLLRQWLAFKQSRRGRIQNDSGDVMQVTECPERTAIRWTLSGESPLPKLESSRQLLQRTLEGGRSESRVVNQPIPELCEWYIFEGLPTSSAEPPGETERAVRLGPFATENECRILLESMQQMPRFSGSALEVNKKSKRREKRTDARLRSLPSPVRDRPEAPICAYRGYCKLRRPVLLIFENRSVLGEIIEVDCDRRNAVFRVVWIGSPGRATEGQAALRA